ncbi:MAG: zinc-binding dehydrogenase [SAR202 cluster bacterium]|nr:zinc-binding dehydrogenase [SAR202 cluster bacterium]
MLKSRVAILTKPHGPLEVGELEIPDPQPHQIVVKLNATGVCLSQVHQIELTPADKCPQLLGHEGVGFASQVGKGVTHVKEGDAVIVTWVPRAGYPGRQFIDNINNGMKYKGKLAHGPVCTFAEDVMAHEQLVIPIKSEDAYPEASIVGCAILTGAGAVFHTAKVRAEESVVVIGAGGVGLSAIKMASLLQAYPVIAVDIADDKLEYSKQWGATHTINSKKVDPVKAVWEITGKGADYAFDAVGLRITHEQLLPMVRGGGPGANNVGGMAVLIGWPQTEMTLNAEHFVYHQRQYRGSHGSSIPEKDFPMYLRLSKEGKFPLKKLVTKSYTLDQAQQSIDDLKAGKITGRAILKFR